MLLDEMTAQKTGAILGIHRHLLVESPWHIGTITYKNDSDQVRRLISNTYMQWYGVGCCFNWL